MYLTISSSATILLTLAAFIVSANEDTSSTSSYLAVESPVWLANIQTPYKDARSLALSEEDIMVRPLDQAKNLHLTNYPSPMMPPPSDDPEVQAVIQQIDWSKVPKAPVRQVTANGELKIASDGDASKDQFCWWSSTLCKTPKLDYIPEDISHCPQAGDWGLNYDDGPYRVWSQDKNEKQYEEPRLYNFLVEQGKLKSTLFYIGSNVLTFPEAAQRAFSDGHTICSHTWSHPYMTTLTNEQIVAELYWTQKAIKQVIGVTPKCWRPPFGDIDDRVRAIAWLMGMRTIIWDRDSNDWGLAAQSITADTVNNYFQNWIDDRAANKDAEHGHIPLQHESSNYTIMLTEKWLPELQKHFNVVSIHQCLGDANPYWEEGPWNNMNPPASSVDRHSSMDDNPSFDNQQSSEDNNSLPNNNNRIAIGTNNKTLSRDHQQVPGHNSSASSASMLLLDSTLLLLSTFFAFVLFA